MSNKQQSVPYQNQALLFHSFSIFFLSICSVDGGKQRGEKNADTLLAHASCICKGLKDYTYRFFKHTSLRTGTTRN